MNLKSIIELKYVFINFLLLSTISINAQKITVELKVGNITDVYGDRDLVLVQTGNKKTKVFDLFGIDPVYTSSDDVTITLLNDSTLVETRHKSYNEPGHLYIKSLEGDSILSSRSSENIFVAGNNDLRLTLRAPTQGYEESSFKLFYYNCTTRSSSRMEFKKTRKDKYGRYLKEGGFYTYPSFHFGMVDAKAHYIGLSSYSDLGSIILEWETGKEIYYSASHKVLGISPTSEYFYIANKDGEIFQVDMISRAETLLVKTGHYGSIANRIRFDNDGNFIVRNKKWEYLYFKKGDAKPTKTIPVEAWLSSNGKYYISFVDNQIYDLQTDKLIRAFDFNNDPATNYVIGNGFAFTTKGRESWNSKDEILKIDLKTGNITADLDGSELRGDSQYALEFEKSIVSGNGEVAINPQVGYIQYNSTGVNTKLDLSGVIRHHITSNHSYTLQAFDFNDLASTNLLETIYHHQNPEYKSIIFDPMNAIYKIKKRREFSRRLTQFNKDVPYSHPLKRAYNEYTGDIRDGVADMLRINFKSKHKPNNYHKTASLNYDGSILAVPGYPTMIYAIDDNSLTLIDSVALYSTSVKFLDNDNLLIQSIFRNEIADKYPNIFPEGKVYETDDPKLLNYFSRFRDTWYPSRRPKSAKIYKLDSVYNVATKSFVNRDDFNLDQEAVEDLDFYVFDDKEFLIIDPVSNQYLISKGAYDKVYFRIGSKSFNFKSFDLFLNRPDIILDKAGQASENVIQAYKNAFIKRLKKAGLKEAQILDILNKEEGFIRTDIPEIGFKTGQKRFIETDQNLFNLELDVSTQQIKSLRV